MASYLRLAPVPSSGFAYLRRAFLGAALTTVVAACSLFAPVADANLDGRTFLSTGVVGAKPLVDATRIRLAFNDAVVTFEGGCNLFGGPYHLDGGTLVFEGGGSTLMGCDPDRLAQDQWFNEFMGSGPMVALAGDTLTLTGGSTVITFMDREAAEPDAQITGPTWTLESISTGDAVSSVPRGVVATLVFRDDGTLDVETGCNTGGATWRPVGAGIEVGDLFMTKKACGRPEGDVEAAVVTLLRAGTIVAAIDADLLTLEAGGSGLAYRAGPGS